MQTYEQRLDQYIEKYSSLVKCAEELIFPSDRRSLPDEAKKWGWPRKLVHRMSHPFTVAETGLRDSLGYFFLVLLMQTNLGWGMMFLAPVMLGSPVILSFADIGSTLSLILAFIFSIPLLAVSYYWLFTIFTDKGFHPKLSFFLVIVDISLLIGFSIIIRNGSVTKHFIISKADIIPLLISFIFFFIPAITYFLIILFESSVLIKQSIVSITRSVKAIHDPLPLEQVKSLAIGDIAAKDNKSTWKLSSLSLHELRALRKWAEANLEATDKRALPAVVVFGFLALLLSSDTVKQSIVEPVTRLWWSEMTFFWTSSNATLARLFSWDYLRAIFVFVVTLMLATYILKTFSRLFRNLPVQSLVVEACILAESAHEENNRDDKNNVSPLQNPLLHFLRDVIELIFKPKRP